MTSQTFHSILNKDHIVVEGYFEATPARVFEAFTDPDIVLKWFGVRPNSLHSAVIDFRVGGNWRFLESVTEQRSIAFEGEYVAIEPAVRLAFSWSKVVLLADGTCNATPVSLVELTFTGIDGGTHLRVVHSDITDQETRDGFAGGWKQGLTNLKAQIEAH